MPSVSPSYRDQQRRRILSAARDCFAANGFHQTSMDDILAGAGMSAGGLYRYFRGKDEIIAAIAEEAIAGITVEVAAMLDDDPVPALVDALVRILQVVDRVTEPGGFGRLVVQAWGEAQRDPALAALAGREYRAVRGQIESLVRRAVDDGRLPADASTPAVAQVLYGIIPGYLVQKLLVGDVDPERYAAGLRALTGGPVR